MPLDLRTCKSCGWVHMAVTFEQALKGMRRFNKYFDGLSKKKQKENYGGKRATLLGYLLCNRCGKDYTNFRASKKDDCPDGCTIGPIVVE